MQSDGSVSIIILGLECALDVPTVYSVDFGS